jgi:DNA-binding response OmpR family regulator
MNTEHEPQYKFTENTRSIDIHRVLLIGSDKNKDIALSMALTREGYHVVYCDSVKKAWILVYPERPDVIILRLGKTDLAGLAELQECRALAEGVPIVLTLDTQVRPAVMADLRHRAAVVVPEPAVPEAIARALHGLHASTA